MAILMEAVGFCACGIDVAAPTQVRVRGWLVASGVGVDVSPLEKGSGGRTT